MYARGMHEQLTRLAMHARSLRLVGMLMATDRRGMSLDGDMWAACHAAA